MVERILNEIPRFFEYYSAIFLLKAMATTLLMTLLGVGLGFLLGFLIVYLRQTPGMFWLPVRIIAITYVEVFRRIPFLVILYLVLFFIQAVSPNASLFTIATIGICMLSIAYTSEIIRAGFESVPRQQVEAASAMNFSRWKILRNVIVPQSWPVILPPAFAYMVSFIKDTALVSQIGVVELTFAGKVMNNRGYSALLVYGTILILYFILSYPLTRLGAHLEKRLAPIKN
ncbi:MAG: amino acid ABC transporter permease [Arenicellales bacterium]|jgi:polar amino acid transport system permease protein|nr:amino acid ABC transporter permease [Pseudomonadales bacterium]MDP7516239.1 amino acid ABC transporter permease [Arenicellales bacterium]|tara:strand:+ start:3792 stop:4478 length:687 start_codon:yes stop_codon:yes gene_type:complete